MAASPDAAFLGGGTTLVDLMKLGVELPRTLVDITRLPLGAIEACDGGLRIGAGVRNSELAAHPEVRRAYPCSRRRCSPGRRVSYATWPRLVATSCNALATRTSRPQQPCNKRQPGTGRPARTGGERRQTAILGASPTCIATHPSDMAAALAALDAVVHVEEPAGPRTIPVGEL